MLDQKILNMLIQNIDILRFSLVFFGVVFITLILWELGLFGGSKSIKAADKFAVEKTKINNAETTEDVKEKTEEKNQEDFDPFRSLMQQKENEANEVKLVESSVLNKIDEKKTETMDIKGSESFRIEDYLSGYQKTTEGLAKFEESSAPGSEPFIPIEKNSAAASSENAIQYSAQEEKSTEESNDPWHSMISKSLEESKTVRQKSIKIDLGMDAEEDQNK